MTMFPRLDPDLLDGGRPFPRACNDGGGRNGNPTLLEAIVVLMGRDPYLRVDSRSLEALGAMCGHKTAVVTMNELREMATKSWTIWMLPSGYEWLVWPTQDGLDLLEARPR